MKVTKYSTLDELMVDLNKPFPWYENCWDWILSIPDFFYSWYWKIHIGLRNVWFWLPTIWTHRAHTTHDIFLMQLKMLEYLKRARDREDEFKSKNDRKVDRSISIMMQLLKRLTQYPYRKMYKDRVEDFPHVTLWHYEEYRLESDARMLYRLFTRHRNDLETL